ncbi:DUF427 domain-containing protein [Undibacterium sp. TS12]|uniref:DUF427 domain-containing protein n=1 Tax=Undibacterium sp. TS12 TaxID=2908202 RepID=UPI001F4CED19|nr:DUF427 domain-containing protein [Undibacterium sp. TS12]MCH8621834.1 DUF427 domain-containing protein [Undibacterium sp. TS12]
MPTATWKNTVIAKATDAEVVIVEGNTYFPLSSVRQEYLRDSDKHTVCSWKGTASYYDIVVNGEVNADAAWYYPAPKDAARQISGYVAFWRGVNVSP